MRLLVACDQNTNILGQSSASITGSDRNILSVMLNNDMSHLLTGCVVTHHLPCLV